VLLIGNVSKKKLVITDNKIIFAISNFFINLKFLKVKTTNNKPITNIMNDPKIPVVVKI
tara:strand:+ start:326 stop:502 length:177 start_codon:yes stop_codon:yes gene_type:complete